MYKRQYKDRYERVDGAWLIAHLHLEVAFFSPLDQGWDKQRFLDGEPEPGRASEMMALRVPRSR